jgi:hypothetical protein
MEKIIVNLSYADIISSIALIIAAIGLTWNIIKDFILDKVSIELYITFGEVGNIKNSETVLFAEAGSLQPNHKFDNTGTLVKIINTGRKSIVIRSIGGKLVDGSYISMAVKGLPKMLQPYEEFSNISEIRDSFMDLVKNNKVKKLWAEDTKGKKWFLSNKGFEKLKTTAIYLNEGKNI